MTVSRFEAFPEKNGSEENLRQGKVRMGPLMHYLEAKYRWHSKVLGAKLLYPVYMCPINRPIDKGINLPIVNLYTVEISCQDTREFFCKDSFSFFVLISGM